MNGVRCRNGDFYQRFGRNVTEVSALRVARGTVVIVGILGTALVGFCSPRCQVSLGRTRQGAWLFGGGLLESSFLVFSPECILLQQLAFREAVVQWWLLKGYQSMVSDFYRGCGCVVIGLITGVFLLECKELDGLTVYTLPRRL